MRAPLVPLHEWRAIQSQKPHVQMCCCTAKGYMRIRFGTPHFVHHSRPSDCIWKPESHEHQSLKALVMRTAIEAGWDAELEEPGPGRKWIADVIAKKKRAKYAFEIQLSPITHADLLRRQRAYAESGVRGCWFVKGPVGQSYYECPSTSEPVFWLQRSDQNALDFRVSVNSQHTLPVDEAVRALLGGQFRWCARRKIKKNLEVVIIRVPSCWFCHMEFETYVLEEFETRCDGEPRPRGYVDERRLIEPAIVQAVQEFVNKHSELSLNIAFPVWSQHPITKRAELSFACAHCGGNYFWNYHQWFWRRIKEPILTFPIKSGDAFEDRPHWCHSREQNFCC